MPDHFLSFWLTFFPLARGQGHFALGNVHAPRVSDLEMLDLGSRFFSHFGEGFLAHSLGVVLWKLFVLRCSIVSLAVPKHTKCMQIPC